MAILYSPRIVGTGKEFTPDQFFFCVTIGWYTPRNDPESAGRSRCLCHLRV
ncbi:hypothetical protein POREN0001_1060 [Porphyromonas endodontalis ATCC 35406]|uniref:Uncharacterized protein n=1 Tax=Porphyromonas endodontalis (strain ATCC 35406 / DSM 24491 / JCM 8526 / CCUG 16442 / BCRC 14492 / NCTC 13058 / HG 370) TaxID=553175 RepID=C3J9C0_POREA|nr:hypothetical protein POREN0001_1060 [Porphyromonas endodontalis ATCC 35406]